MLMGCDSLKPGTKTRLLLLVLSEFDENPTAWHVSLHAASMRRRGNQLCSAGMSSIIAKSFFTMITNVLKPHRMSVDVASCGICRCMSSMLRSMVQRRMIGDSGL
ncbi:hypothetical protein FVEG_16519 [Fusarium verticillioides 7600]|uniref:Uncharacterized protein n=1 Tax=Gibberella moniliformis (strain M3125 / FGSC 7600) TaxID=334819 RepID=W7MPV9_GIBM7|nr:hypothetical protein FVEG_16519 [Fusarium verticillioides 7600]EWG49645.1 hypothetical protein FVEG_16519 [Fusarium verticillioides 7600]